MATYPDHARAVRAFKEALKFSAHVGDLPPDWLARIARVRSGKAKTLTPALGTALLARATDAHVDPLTLKASADHSHGLRAYTARGLGHEVLVPLCQENGIDLRVRGREPLNNSPFFRAERIQRRMDAKYPDELEFLVDTLEVVKGLSPADATLALAAFIRLGREAHEASVSPLPLFATDVDLARLILLTQGYVSDAAESGRRGQAMVAAALDFSAPKVQTGNVFASSRSLPGDVVVTQASGDLLPVEVRQKAVKRKDVISSLEAVRSAGLHQLGYVAIGDDEGELEWAELEATAASEYGVALWHETTVGSFMARSAAASGDVASFVREFPKRMLARLKDVGVDRSSTEDWVAKVGSSATRSTPQARSAASAAGRSIDE